MGNAKENSDKAAAEVSHLRLTRNDGLIHTIEWADLQFCRVPYQFDSSCGVPQRSWVPVGMPVLPRNVVNCVFYLYRSVDDAKAGRSPCGTGFVVAVCTMPHVRTPKFYYGVTNWHVAIRDGASVVRINSVDGGVDVIEFDPSEWEFMPGGHDIAAIELNLDSKVHDLSAVDVRMLLSRPSSGMTLNELIAVGDDTFMVGLFADNSGVELNIPSARFGNVSMLPHEMATVKEPTGLRGANFIVDMHSRTGFSGSPVFAYRTFGSDLSASYGEGFEALDIEFNEAQFSSNGRDYAGRESFRGRIKSHNGRLKPRTMLRLLGIHWGQFSEAMPYDRKRLETMSEPETSLERQYVHGFSGMTCVVPSWDILDILNLPVFTTRRKIATDKWLESKNVGPIAD